MKNSTKLFAFIALAAVMTFTLVFTACKDDDEDKEDGGGGGAVSGISSLVLSGQVYAFGPYKGNVNISGVGNMDDWQQLNNIGTGKITNGVLNYTIGTPSGGLLIEYRYYHNEYLFSPIETVSNNNVKFFYFDYLKADFEDYEFLLKGSLSNSSWDYIKYIYVDTDVTISSLKTTETEDDYYERITTVNAFSLSLKKGWNTVYVKEQYQYSSDISTYTCSFSLSNPTNLYWAFMPDF